MRLMDNRHSGPLFVISQCDGVAWTVLMNRVQAP